jgi:hypothetical protein
MDGCIRLQFLAAHKLRGSGKNIIKNKNKEQLIADYKLLFATKVPFFCGHCFFSML